MLKLKANKSIEAETARTFTKKFFLIPFSFLFGVGVVCNLVFIKPQAALSELDSPSTGTSSILEVPSSDKEVKLTFTLHNLNNVQYFSAGVGVEERNASYPAYPLKLIFVQGERAFLADVKISIAKSDGTSLVEIPSEHVMGPWLFVKIPSGPYTFTATDSHQRVIKKEVQVGGAGTQVVHFRWPAL